MPYVIKRYANRKLYDTRTKRYLTLDEISVLVRSGEDVRVEDADSSEDLTSQILTKIIAEGNRKGGSMLLPQKILVDLIQRPSETVLDAVRTSVSAGQRAAEQMSGEVGRLLESVKGRAERGGRKALAAAPEAPEAVDAMVRALEERLRSVIAGLGLPTREEFDELAARVAALETRAKPPARKPAAKRPAPRMQKS